MGEKTEVKPQCIQSILVNGCLPVVIELRQYPPVPSKEAMNITDEIICFAVQPVIVIIPALVRTEFLIGATTNGVAAIETFPFHSTKVLLKLRKTDLYSFTNTYK